MAITLTNQHHTSTKEPGTYVCEQDFTNNQRPIVPRDQLDQWVGRYIPQRRSSLNNASPKTKRIRSKRKRRHAAYQPILRPIRETTAERAHSMNQPAYNPSVEEERFAGPKSTVDAEHLAEVTSAVVATNDALIRRWIAQPVEQQDRIHQSTSSNSNPSHVRSSFTENIDKINSNASISSKTAKKDLVLRYVKTFWAKLKDKFRVSVKPGNSCLRQTESFSVEESQNLLVNHPSFSEGALDESNDEVVSRTRFQEEDDLLSSINSPRPFPWSRLFDMSPLIREFRCQSTRCPCRGEQTDLSWLSPWLNWFHSKPTNSISPRPTQRPALHSRSTAELLSIRKSFTKIARREIGKEFHMNSNTKGRKDWYLVGSGRGLSVILEEEDGKEAVMGCWRCDTCAHCLVMALNEAHPFWDRSCRKAHTCCPREKS